MREQFTSTDILFYMAKSITKNALGLSHGEKIVITGGDTSGTSGKSNLLKVEDI